MTKIYLDYHGHPIKQGFYEHENNLILITTGGICDTPKETIHTLEARLCCDDLSFAVFHQDYEGEGMKSNELIPIEDPKKYVSELRKKWKWDMWPERFIEEILRQLEEGKKMGILVDKFVLQ